DADRAPSAARHALAQWGAIAWVALVAVWLDHPEIAVGVIFSTSVAALSLHLGVAVASIPQARRAGHGFDIVLDPSGDARSGASASLPGNRITPSRAWAFVLPTAVLTLVVGFSGKLTLIHALVLALEGVLVATVWQQAGQGIPPEASRRLSTERKLQLALAVVLGAVGAVAAVYGAVRMSAETKIMSTGLIASAALGPLLILPMIGSASVLASHGHAQTAVGASVMIVFLNLCLLLPVAVTVWHVRQMFVVPPVVEAVTPTTKSTTTAPMAPTTTTTTTQAIDDESFVDEEAAFSVDDMPKVFTFPIATWRIDTVLLILLGLMILPVALNLWEIRRSEGLLLIVVYACYLVATTFLGRRW
ncbi:MAG: hypothetical protein WBD40_14475, partial [Tepidisphaeraceae bacterium]